MPAERLPPSQRDPIIDHAGDPRVAASIVLVGVVGALIGGVFMAIGPQLKPDASVARASADSNVVTVRVVGLTPAEKASCESQTWPNIDQRCLVRAKTESPTPAVPAKTEEDAKLSPLTATGAAVKVQAAPQEPVVVALDNAAVADTATLANDEARNVQPEPRQRPRRPPGFSFPFGFRF